MTFSLVKNFFSFARGLIFKDSASVTWSFNKSTNEITATASGGTSSPLTTKGDVWGYDTGNNRIPIGSDGQVLTADSTKALGLKWAAGGGISNVTVDTPPSSPTIYDDEFTEGALDTGGTRTPGANPWAWINQGSTTVSLSNGSLIMTLADTTSNQRIIAQTVPAGSWTFRAKCNFISAAASFCAGGICLYNSVNGHFVALQNLGGGSNADFTVDEWSAVTGTFSSRPINIGTPYNTGSLDNAAAWFYLQLRYDGTNFYASVSTSGLPGTFAKGVTGAPVEYSEAVATFLGTPTHIGMFATSNTGTAGSLLLVDWFRRIA